MAALLATRYVRDAHSAVPASPACPTWRFFGVTGPEMSVIRLELLGRLDVTEVERAPTEAPMRRSKRVALLAYLAAARPRGFHRRDKLAAVFWSELAPDRARAALRTTLSRLRAEYGADAILGRGADEIAVSSGVIRCDVVEFDAAMATGQFEEAARLYRGPFLDGVHVEGAGEEMESWIAVERLRLHDAVLQALASASAQAEERDQPLVALQHAQRALEISPNDEVAARRVMALSLAAGNRGGAMRAYDELARRLRIDFDVEPASETQAMIASARARVNVSLSARPMQAAPEPVVFGGAASAPVARRQQWPMRLTAVAIVTALSSVAWIATHRAAAPSRVAREEWRAVLPTDVGPPAAFGGRAVLDSTGDALLVFGGVADVRRQALVDIGSGYWRLRGFGAGSGTSWSRVTTAEGPRPSPRWIYGVSYARASDRMILHGGALGFTSPCSDETWVLDHASGVGHMPKWNEVRIRGARPPRRAGFQQVFDAVNRRLIVFAGHDCIYPKFDDTWVLAFDDSTLSSGTWMMLNPDSSAGIPRARDNYAAAFDSATGRLFVFGGRASAMPTDELWALEHANGIQGIPAWHPVRCSGEAPVNAGGASVFDAAGDAWTLFGGSNAAGQVVRSVWRLHGLAHDVPHCWWEQLSVGEPTPAARSGASAVLLPTSRGMLVFGGEFANTPLSDAWVLRSAAVQH
jgi:DNA-binding transcriptional activator of the SARP family